MMILGNVVYNLIINSIVWLIVILFAYIVCMAYIVAYCMLFGTPARNEYGWLGDIVGITSGYELKNMVERLRKIASKQGVSMSSLRRSLEYLFYHKLLTISQIEIMGQKTYISPEAVQRTILDYLTSKDVRLDEIDMSALEGLLIKNCMKEQSDNAKKGPEKNILKTSDF